MDGEAGEKVVNGLKDISPDLGKYIIEYTFGDIYANDQLDLKSQETVVVATLTAIGTARPQLKFHINAGLNIGLTIDDIKEIMLLMNIYAGFPSAINGTNILKEVTAHRQ
ncbi:MULTISPECIES: carboxymuconolactone decarboxylase family protein [Chitinophagaceae]